MITDKPSVAGNSKYSYYRCKYLKSRSMYCEDDLPKWGLADTQSQSWFACAVMAMLNVCKQSSFFDVNSVKDLSRAYCNLYSMANTDDNGYTREDILGDTIQRFAKASKNIDVSYTYKENPSTSYFVSAINNDYSAILGLVGKEGHAVSVNGYVQYKNISTGSVKTYLCVADGWYEKTRYICLSTIKARSTSGTVIKYKIK